MKITWIGHSCFKIEKNEYSVVTDPYNDGHVPGYQPVRDTANMVLCSHEHADHNARNKVVIEENPECPFSISKIETWHDEEEGALRGRNTIHIFEDGTYKIVHFGDIGCQLTKTQAQALSGADVVMIPVGGFYTVNAEEAADIVKMIQPKIIVPMHYQGDGFGFDVIGGVDAFAEMFEDVERLNTASFEVEDYLAEDKNGKVLILTPQNH